MLIEKLYYFRWPSEKFYFINLLYAVNINSKFRLSEGRKRLLWSALKNLEYNFRQLLHNKRKRKYNRDKLTEINDIEILAVQIESFADQVKPSTP